MVAQIRARQPDLEITDREELLVKIAGLVHDLGHGPFSHVFDGEFMPRARPERHWHHETGSEMMLDLLLSENNIEMEEADIRAVKELIHPGVHER